MSQKNNDSNNSDETEFIDIDYQINESENDNSLQSSKDSKVNSNSAKNSTDKKAIDELNSLYKQIEEKDAQYDKVYSRYLRALADYENLEKRSKSEKKRIIKQANENLLLKLLNLADAFEKAENNISLEEPIKLESAVDGFNAVQKLYNTILKNEGIERIIAKGEKFNPNFHEVVFVKQDSKFEEDTILEEIQVGYLLNSNLLRPSKVVISKPPK